MLRDLLGTVLRARGFNVRVAQDVKTANEMVQMRVPDILVTDVELPDQSGLELARETLENYPACRVIVMSGSVELLHTGSLSIKDGLIVPFLRKPFPLSAFLGLVGALQ